MQRVQTTQDRTRPRRRGPRVPKGRVLTVGNLIQRIVAETGRQPTNAELATLLATSERHVARARALIGGGP